jgi:HEAT repeat protein
LGAAEWTVAEKPLLLALADTHADVRKAAVQALSRWAGEVSQELTAALDDQDADVRAYARYALS